MHAIEGSSNVPAFLTKLWRLVDDAKTNDLISWTQNGRSFIIQNQAKFSRELLPQYYKHNNMASFVRQLNMYGFHKVVSADSGGLRVERDDMEFAHPHFLRGQENLLENIKRKIPSGRTVIVEDNKNVSKLLNDVRDMKRDQDSMSSKLLNLKRENEALWREYANMRQKFTKQQQIIEKLIHFLIAMVKSPSKGLVPKRKFSHLALEGGDESASLSKINTIHQFLQGNSIDVLGPSEANNGGAQIQEVMEDSDSSQGSSSSGGGAAAAAAAAAAHHNSQNENLEEQVIVSDLEPGSILDIDGEPHEFIDVTDHDHISATSVVSPQGTVMMSTITNPLMDEDPLSPELLNVVDPSAVTQSFKYPASCTDPPTTSVMCSTGDKSGAAAGGSSASPQTPSLNTQLHTVKQEGKKNSVTAQKTPPEDASMRLAVPDKSMNRHDLQNHMDDMQTNMDNLQDFLTNANLNVDPSMLHSVFGFDNDLPELDSMATVISGSLEEVMPLFWCSKGNFSGDLHSNELSVYNPNFLDLAESLDEEKDDDPLAFLMDSFASTSATPQSSSSSNTTTTTTTTTTPSSTSITNTTVPSNKSSRPPPPKHLKVTIKKEPEVENSLETPVVSPLSSASLYRGKRHAN